MVSDLCSQDRQQVGVLDVVDAPCEISLHAPLGPDPRLMKLVQGGVATPVWSEAVGVGGNLWVGIRLSDGASDFLEPLIRPWGNAERACFPGAWWYGYPSPGGPLPALRSSRLEAMGALCL